MLPPEPDLEVRSRRPARNGSRPPLLFVHGAYCDGWCWEAHFLPWFAAHRYESHALSLRGHGRSQGYESLFVSGLDDFAADVSRVAAQLSSPPVLIGHSMGAAIVERLLATVSVRAVALLAPIPPAGLGPVVHRLAAQHPEYLVNLHRLNAPHLRGDVLAALRPMYFSDDIDPLVLGQTVVHLTLESPRALFELTFPWKKERPATPVRPFVLGVTGDRIAAPSEVKATAAFYDTTATIVPGLAHMMMLERDWESVARPLLEWLEEEFS